MTSISILFFAALIFTAVIIFYQDFKDRLVSLLMLLLFGAVCTASVLYYRDIKTFLYNIFSTVVYITFLWSILKLYLFLKHKKNVPIIDHQFGMADVVVIIFIGVTFNGVGLILFFCSGFVFSLLSFLLYSLLHKKEMNTPIPLAGLLVFYYVLSILVLPTIHAHHLIDCSFVNP